MAYQIKKILVTGASGYIASWIVKFLLEKNYTVHGTVRKLTDEKKMKHLIEMKKTFPDTFQLFEADLLKDGSFAKAMEHCDAIIHCASPFIIQKVKDSNRELIDPALKGTQNVLNAIKPTSNIRRVVLTSSVVAINGDAIELLNNGTSQFTEEHWNTTSTEKYQPYNYSKTLAEKEAWKIAESQNNWDLVVVNPGFVLGPSLSERLDNTSTDFMASLINGSYRAGIPDLYFGAVDVRDVAIAHIKALLTRTARGRHIIVARNMGTSELVGILKKAGKYKKLPKRILPKPLLYVLGPFLGFSRTYIKRNVGIPVSYNNNYSISNLEMEYRNINGTILEQAEQLEKLVKL